jgi:DNA-binding FadR family transcriptional regulator
VTTARRLTVVTINAPTLASVVASRIEEEVVARDWPIGQVLGLETELIERYAVSRAVLREAVRLVEHAGVARMRRGPGGGLVVSQPDRRAVVRAMAVWCSYSQVTIGHLLEVRRPLLSEAVRLIAARRPTTQLDELDRAISAILARGGPLATEIIGVESRLVAIADNPAMSLFVDALADIAADRIRSGRAGFDSSFTDDDARAQLLGYRRLVGTVRDSDPDDAAAAIGVLIDGVAVRLRELDGVAATDAAQPARSDQHKLAELVALGLRDEIERRGWPVGSTLGSEGEVREHYDVSPAVLRAAVRILERDGALRTKRGPHGGLVVTAPDGAATARCARLLLEYEGVDARDLLETRAALDIASVRFAAERIDGINRELIMRAMNDARGSDGLSIGSFVRVLQAIGDATDNPLFSLFGGVIGELMTTHLDASRLPNADSYAHAARSALQRITAAIADGEADRAEAYMRRQVGAGLAVLTLATGSA